MEAVSHSGMLAAHTLVDTRSPEEARQEIGRIFCPHFLSPVGREGFHAVHRSSRQRGFSLNFVSYGCAVDIDPGELSRFFLLQMPLSGTASVRCGKETALASPRRVASLLSPTLPTVMRWSDGCDKLIVLIEREALQLQGAALAERGIGDIEFATAIDIAAAPGRLIVDHVGLMAESVAAGGPMAANYLARLGESLGYLLLSSLPHSQRAALDGPPPAALGRNAVARAEEWIRDNVDRPFTAADVAEAAGTSLRSLQEGLRRQKATTLMRMVETIRLDRFRAALTDPSGRQTVTEAAYAAGLGHLGRAAIAYRRRYGETPVETLRRKK
ncbi:helix-turn-helix domain-containing protein [Kumtagia ephedrae]|nr:AraC family transcriptional regulator [Mesorhizobium ephedrae]